MEYPDSTSVANTKQMGESCAELYLFCVVAEQKVSKKPLPEEDLPFSSKVIKARIDGLSLPITFTPAALVAAGALTEGNPGKGVVLLCDCLQSYEGKEVTVLMLTALYPWGFYNDEVFTSIVDEWMKPRKHKWGHIY